MATILGNGEANILNGSPFDDIIRGLDGEDTIFGRGGNRPHRRQRR